MLLKRAMKGELPLFDFAQTVEEELTTGSAPEGQAATTRTRPRCSPPSNFKRMAVYGLKVAAETFGPELEKQPGGARRAGRTW